jgi:hypothetical protein
VGFHFYPAYPITDTFESWMVQHLEDVCLMAIDTEADSAVDARATYHHTLYRHRAALILQLVSASCLWFFINVFILRVRTES